MSAQLKNYEKQDMQVGDAHADAPRQSDVRGIDKCVHCVVLIGTVSAESTTETPHISQWRLIGVRHNQEQQTMDKIVAIRIPSAAVENRVVRRNSSVDVGHRCGLGTKFFLFMKNVLQTT